MSDAAFYLFVAFVASLGLVAAIRDRRRQKSMPPPTRREKWLSARSSLGAALVVISSVIGAVPLLFAIMYLNASDAGAHNHRDSLIVIVVVCSLIVLGLALYVPVQRELRQLRESRSSRKL